MTAWLVCTFSVFDSSKVLQFIDRIYFNPTYAPHFVYFVISPHSMVLVKDSLLLVSHLVEDLPEAVRRELVIYSWVELKKKGGISSRGNPRLPVASANSRDVVVNPREWQIVNSFIGLTVAS